MTDALLEERRAGSRRPIEMLIGPFPEPRDIGSRPVTFWMWRTDNAQTRLINGGEATATDAGLALGLTPGTLWRLRYAPTEGEDDVVGFHKAQFEVDYGGGQERQYPGGRNFIDVVIRPHKGNTPT